MARVIARINKHTGDLELDVSGIKGTTCTDITDFVMQNLDVYSDEKKEEYFDVCSEPEYVENL